VRHPLWNLWLRANDFVLESFGSDREPAVLTLPRKVLIAVGGHLGDGVIATSIFAPLRAAFPGAQIGVVTGSWNRDVFADHPQVCWLHLVDHWKLDRSPGRWLPRRWWGARRAKARALAEIAAVRYDAALDLYAYYPNSARLLARAGIPIRVGFNSGGDGSLYTHARDWRAGHHASIDHLALLEALGQATYTSRLRYDLPEAPAAAAESAERQLRDAGVALDKYVVIHPGAGSARKEWRVEHWRAVARELRSTGTHMVLTGAGKAQRHTGREIANEITGVVNMCDRLTWQEFRHVLAQARVVVSVDTVTTHLAAAAGTPCVAIMTGIDDPERWRPLGEHVTVLTEAVPCSPCFRSHGCTSMACVRGVSPAAVVSATMPFLDVPAAARS
jgi:ADP-heptose:LPS heptosyltransferase